MVRAVYLAMDLTAWFVIVPLSLASLLTGLVQSLFLFGVWALEDLNSDLLCVSQIIAVGLLWAESATDRVWCGVSHLGYTDTIRLHRGLSGLKGATARAPRRSARILP